MAEDFIRQLGFLGLGSRFKRLGERLQADTQQILNELDADIQSSQHVILAAIDRLGPLTIGALAKALGVAQPGVTRSLSPLIDRGLISIHPTPGDQRQKRISLTAAGQTIIDTAKRDIWPRVEQAVIDLCQDLPENLLAQIALVEDRLDQAPLYQRAKEKPGKRKR